MRNLRTHILIARRRNLISSALHAMSSLEAIMLLYIFALYPEIVHIEKFKQYKTLQESSYMRTIQYI